MQELTGDHPVFVSSINLNFQKRFGLAAESEQPSKLRTIYRDALESGFRKGASSILEK